MKLIVIVKTNLHFFAPFLETNIFRCVIGEFRHKIRFITISADIQTTTLNYVKNSEEMAVQLKTYSTLIRSKDSKSHFCSGTTICATQNHSLYL